MARAQTRDLGAAARNLSDLSPRLGTLRKENPYQHLDTPPAGTRALLKAEGRRMRGLGPAIWECACGPGEMAKVLTEEGFNVIGTDIRAAGGKGRKARIWGDGGIDFLATRKLRAKIIVTNPPFAAVADDFIRHAVALKPLFLALLLPAHFFQSSIARRYLFRRMPPSRIWPIGFRLDFTGQGKTPPMFHAWFVWDFAPHLPHAHARAADAPKWLGAPAALLMPAIELSEVS